MALTHFRAVEVTESNVITVGENSEPYKPVYLPFCPLPGKESECEQRLREILAEEEGVGVLVLQHFSANPIIYDVRCDSLNKRLSDILVEEGIAIKWNWPGE